METISVTIPREKEALLKTADYLRSLAGVETAATVSPVIEELSPEAEAEEMGQRIDDTVAAASAATGTATAPPTHDSAGMLWDVRIHASSKAFVADGTWRLKRGVAPELVEQVKAELSGGEESVIEVAATTPAAVVPAPEVVYPPVVAPVAPPVVTPIETPAAPAAITTYAQLIPRITAQANAKVLQANDVMNALTDTGAFAAGVINLTELAKPEHALYIPLVAAELERVWATRA
ncbi:hypothetical protein KAR91_78455 [Candidatus Pacearchaeota archaeon]|nr:hypothetical protein [Candidatus Pacearchaeota archaeon]